MVITQVLFRNYQFKRYYSLNKIQATRLKTLTSMVVPSFWYTTLYSRLSFVHSNSLIIIFYGSDFRLVHWNASHTAYLVCINLLSYFSYFLDCATHTQKGHRGLIYSPSGERANYASHLLTMYGYLLLFGSESVREKERVGGGAFVIKIKVYLLFPDSWTVKENKRRRNYFGSGPTLYNICMMFILPKKRACTSCSTRIVYEWHNVTEIHGYK